MSRERRSPGQYIGGLIFTSERRNRRAMMRRSVKLGVLVSSCLIAVVIQWSYFWGERVSALEEGQTIYEQINHLRVVEQDYVAASALASDYLSTAPSGDAMMDHLVHFESAMILHDQALFNNDPALFNDAKIVFAEVVSTYGSEPLDQSSVDYRVDDAQFMVGHIEQNFIVGATGIAAYQLVVQDYLLSDRRAEALLNLGIIHEEIGDTTSALNYYDQLINEYPNINFVPQSWMNKGQIHWTAKNYGAAETAYQTVIDDWPQSEHVLNALSSLISVLMDEHLEVCCPHDIPIPDDDGCDDNILPVSVVGGIEPQSGPVSGCLVDNTPAINQHTNTVVNVHQDPATSISVLLNNVNFVERQRNCNLASNGELNTTRIQMITQMQTIAPNDPVTIRATLDLAQAVFEDDPAQALSLVESVVTAAQTSGDDDLHMDALLVKARFQANQGDSALAIITLQSILSQSTSAVRRGQAALQVGLIYFNDGGFPLAQVVFNLLDNEEFGPDIRASAKFYTYKGLKIEGLDAEAEQKKTELLTQYPDSSAALIVTTEEALGY